MLTRRRTRVQGQVLVLGALFLGFLMTAAALVIDIGTGQQVRVNTQNVADAAALAGMTQIVAGGTATQARARALDICRLNGLQIGQNGVSSITTNAFRREVWPGEDPQQSSRDDADRYQVIIVRRLPTYFAGTIGVAPSDTRIQATAAVLGTAPASVDLGGAVSFPDRANLAQFGPDAVYSYGDCYSTRNLDNGTPNPRYAPRGYAYDLFVPSDLTASSGSSRVRVEIFDADTINRPGHVRRDPLPMRDTNGDPTEPEEGALDEIRSPPPNGDATPTAAQFGSRSTQTQFTLEDARGTLIATASYGPASNTPYWYHRDDPVVDPLRTASHADPAQAQDRVDLRWITPQGFEFDTSGYQPPFALYVRTIAGSSENGYSLRLSTHRNHGVAFNPLNHGLTGTAALGIYARGKLPINFISSAVTKIPIASIPAGAQQVVVTNFDTDVGTRSLAFTMTGFDATSGQGRYPILFPAPGGASGATVVGDSSGKKYYTQLSGTLSAGGQFATDQLTVPAQVVIPRTDGNGNLLLDAQGRITAVDTRAFEGADVGVTYQAGANDTSVWETSFAGLQGGSQQIVLIR